MRCKYCGGKAVEQGSGVYFTAVHVGAHTCKYDKLGEDDVMECEVRIRWGSESTREDMGNVTSTYAFDTDAELSAFLKGVDEACGWMDYEVVEDEGDKSEESASHAED
jgi:hypothetical protein